jgi:hypothetical protein
MIGNNRGLPPRGYYGRSWIFISRGAEARG